MKRNVAIIFNILSLALIFEATSFLNNLLAFIIAGAVPGTSISLSPVVMFLVIVVFGLLLIRKAQKIFEVKEEVVQKTMPRKRYARL